MFNLKMVDTAGDGIRKMFLHQRERFFPLPDNNEAFHRMLTEGVDVKFDIGEGKTKGDKVWLVDFWTKDE